MPDSESGPVGRSHGPPAILSASRLAELERAIEPHAPGLCDSFPAGLGDGHIDELTAPLGLRLPGEARALWNWRNGYADAIFGWLHAPLTSQIDSYRRCRQIAHDRAKDLGSTMPEYDDPELWWPRYWFPIFEPSGTDERAIACSTAGDHMPSPIWMIDWTNPEPEGPPLPTWESLGDLVTTWIGLLDDDEFTYDAERGWQPRDRERWGHWGYLHPHHLGSR